jgi:hypothetical protein
VLAVIKPGDTFLARHDDRNVAPSGSEGAVEDACDIRRIFAPPI